MGDRAPNAKIRVDDVTETFAPRRRPDITSVELDGEAELFDGDTSYRLDRIATTLWNCFDGTLTIGELVDDLGAVYEGAGRAEIRDGVLACVQTLARGGLFANVDAPGDERPQ